MRHVESNESFESLVAGICLNARAASDLNEATRLTVQALDDDEFWTEPMCDDVLVGVLREIIEKIKYWDHDKCPVCRKYPGFDHGDECPLVRAETFLKERPLNED